MENTNWIIYRSDAKAIPKHSVGIAFGKHRDEYRVFFPGLEAEKLVSIQDIESFDVLSHEGTICNRCFVLKDEDDFYIVKQLPDGTVRRRAQCAACVVQFKCKKITKPNKQRFERLKPQDGTLYRCPACRRSGIVGVNMVIKINLDHATGIPRAWICDHCNVSIGRFRDDPDVLKMILSYLELGQYVEKQSKLVR